ncbi:uncharacterized protein STEHIDRAFT_126547 [Stereum hirsutum FP-91666 SS1]|uniref:DUF6533 domain-containing protein n=1 Tax=Stereum hirsutum (strain FP-91666) TaxID=721885 RepID=R7RY91_STEHR|nr:uncharacterized protein STEHIDRAFT_126547 [Stereum hirsutum FP-91666 SS1]EIM79317.1 hypothetical protein STEHIDRAFT_126547 [Stereum hirsutum FP-91666 SS1]
MSAAEAAALEHIVKVAQIYVASTTSVLVWDWLVCLPQEWRYIWKADWTAIKVLYLMVRYYTFVVLVVTDVWFFADWSEASCAKNLRVLPGIAVVIDVCVELVLALRVYALYGRSTRILMFLGVMMAGFTGVMIAVPIMAFDYTRLPSWPGPCLVTGKPSAAGPKFIIAFYASPMAVDFTLTALTLWRGLRVKRHGSASGLMNVFIKDGLFYFVAISSLNLINVIFFVQPNVLIESINAPMSIQLSTVLSCRLILNLRAIRDRAPTVNKFSNTLGRWVADFQPEPSTDHHNASIALSSRSAHTERATTVSVPKSNDPISSTNADTDSYPTKYGYGW